MHITSLIDPYAIHYDSFALDVYTLDTAGITLSAGTLTAFNALIAPSATAQYLLKGDSAGTSITLANTISAQASILRLYAADGDLSDIVGIQIHSKGNTTSRANNERLDIQSTRTDPWNFEIKSTAAGADPGVAVRPLYLYTGANTSQLVLNVDGKVGIGTATPQELLHVFGDNPVLEIEDSVATTENAKLKITTAGGSWGIGQDSTLGGVGELVFINTIGGASMTLGAAGNVAIANDLTIDTTTLVVDSVNHNVQITELGLGLVGAIVRPLTIRQTADSEGLVVYGFDDRSANSAQLNVNAVGSSVFSASTNFVVGAGGYVYFYTGAGQEMYLNCGGMFNFRDQDAASAVRATIDSANGNAVFSGSMTAASGVITNGLTVDTTTLVVDSTNHRVGIGIAAPLVPLDSVGISHFGDSATNYTAFSATGDLSMAGTATVFNDLQLAISHGKVAAANFPDYVAFTTNTREYQFAVDDYIDLAVNELLHSWKEGTAGNFHVHVTLDDANATGSNRFAKFTLYVAYQNASDIWVETPLTQELTIPTGSVTLKGFYLDLGDVDLSGITIGNHVKLRIKRIAATGGTEYADHIFITQVGCHLEEDTIGSRQELTK